MLTHVSIDFINEVLSRVKFVYDRESIEKELKNHIEDKIENYQQNGYSDTEAELLTIRDMGNPKEIGDELNKQHNPFIVWISIITSLMVWFVIFIVLMLVLPQIIYPLFIGNLANDIPKNEIVYKIDVDEKVQIDNRIITITDVIFDKNGTLHLFYSNFEKWNLGSGWSFSLTGLIYDNLGKNYLGGQYSRRGIVSKSHMQLKNFNKEANSLIISYDYHNRKFKVVIPLKGGDINE